ncbi:hypothetical protein CWC22_012070 [Pseudoalteromonas rubra]|uniref:Uncharacterized protein n=1 Tax=Pseudoalteromonas rubra TaxID=43658 RepID=A0A5S3UQE3_9GAMM|nr:hypothetical protein [Pseudoalteromonas rubra]QPB83687.1 hypothetical protein CWC22_012070 [Pseudoalteromonas rubra]
MTKCRLGCNSHPKGFREITRQLGSQYGALITLVAFQQTEANNKNSRHSVPSDVLKSQVDRLQWPARSEGHRMLVIGNQGVELSRTGRF